MCPVVKNQDAGWMDGNISEQRVLKGNKDSEEITLNVLTYGQLASLLWAWGEGEHKAVGMRGGVKLLTF